MTKKQPEQKLYHFRDMSFAHVQRYPSHCNQYGEQRILTPCSKCGREVTSSLYYTELEAKQGTTWPDILSVGSGIVVSTKVLEALKEIEATGFTIYEVNVTAASQKLKAVEPPKYVGLNVIKGGISPDTSQTVVAPFRSCSDEKNIDDFSEFCQQCLYLIDNTKGTDFLRFVKFIPSMDTWDNKDIVKCGTNIFVSKKVARMFLQKKFTNVFLQHGDCINDYEMPKRIKRIGDL